MDLGSALSLAVGVVETSIAIYQAAIIRESKHRKIELQFNLAGINHSALHKQQAWANQIATLRDSDVGQDFEKVHIYIRARDDFAELAQMVVALEGTIDPGNSAIVGLMDKSLAVVQRNNTLQEEGVKNPAGETQK